MIPIDNEHRLITLSLLQSWFPLTMNTDWSHCHCYRLSWFPLTVNTHCHCYRLLGLLLTVNTLITLSLLQAVMIPIDSEHRLITLLLLQAVGIPVEVNTGWSHCHCYRLSCFPLTVNTYWSHCYCYRLSYSCWQWTQTGQIVIVTGCHDSHWRWTQTDHIVTVTGCHDSYWQWTPITLSLLQSWFPLTVNTDWSHCHCYRLSYSRWLWTQTDHIVMVTGCYIPVDSKHRLITLSLLQAVMIFFFITISVCHALHCMHVWS